VADEFIAHATKGGEYSRGFVAAMVEFLAFHESTGAPNLDVWRPLEMELRYTNRGSHPTPGAKLFEYRGVPVSVAPDHTAHSWGDEDTLERSPEFPEAVVASGRPLSQRAFNAMRAQAAKGSAT
jgi:hypothetical protein